MRGCLLLIIVLLAPAYLPGCATSQSADSAHDRMGGVTLDVRVHRGPNSEALYRVSRDGTLAYAGGQAAREREFTWSGRMSDENILSLRTALDAHGWMTGTPPPTQSPSDDEQSDALIPIRINVDLRGPHARHKFTIHGSNASTQQIIAILEDASLARHAEFLDSLPKPSGQRQDGS